MGQKENMIGLSVNKHNPGLKQTYILLSEFLKMATPTTQKSASSETTRLCVFTRKEFKVYFYSVAVDHITTPS